MKLKQWMLFTILLSCCAGLLYTQGLFVNAGDAPPITSPLPTPSPAPISPEAAIALRYIAEREGLAPEQLEVAGEESVTFQFLDKSYIYITLFYNQPETSQIFSLLVDPVTKAVEPDYNAIRALDRAAAQGRYGKLEPALYERLQKIDDTDEVLVAIWLAHSTTERSPEEIIAAVIATYPEAADALATEGILWDVDDPKLSVAIQLEYERLIFENISLRAEALADWLQAEGFLIETTEGMPVLYATLPKQTILTVEKRDDVARIFAADSKVTPASGISIQTDRAPIVWNRGYKGNGINLAPRFRHVSA